MATTLRAPGALRQLLRRIHSWTGLLLCLPLALLGISGSLLVVQAPLDRLLAPSLYRASAAGAWQPLDDIFRTARAAAPAGMAPTLLLAPESAQDPVILRLGQPGVAGPGQLEMFIDPVTLDVVGTRDPATSAIRWLHRLHENFFSGPAGRQLVGGLGIAMLLLGISGPVLWWPGRRRWRSAFTLPRQARGFGFHRALHGTVGAWGLVAFLVISLSGVYLGFPREIAGAVGSVMTVTLATPAAPGLRVTPSADGPRLDLDQAVALARSAIPDGKLRFVALPLRPDQPLRISFAADGGRRGGTALIDPGQGRIVQITGPASGASGDRLLAWLRALHVGAALGWVWQVVAVAAGLLPPLFAITGFAMLATRRPDAPPQTVARAAPEAAE